MSEVRVGNGLTEGVTCGRLIDKAAFEKVNRLVEDAVAAEQLSP